MGDPIAFVMWKVTTLAHVVSGEGNSVTQCWVIGSIPRGGPNSVRYVKGNNNIV